jgi:1-aminocyclopropane-1-carboxylate synthase
MGLPGKNKGAVLSKIATNNQHGENSEYFDGWKAYDKDPFHLSRNPHGIIQMGLAENQVQIIYNPINHVICCCRCA